MKLVAVISIVVGLIFFAVGMVIQPGLVVNFVNFVGVFVAFIPQGLPSTVSIMLTYAAKKLAAHNVRRLGNPRPQHQHLDTCLPTRNHRNENHFFNSASSGIRARLFRL